VAEPQSTSRPTAVSTWRLAAVVSVLLVVATLACYHRVWTQGFVNYDDPEFVESNTRLARGFTGANLAWAWRIDTPSQWHPLTWYSYMLDVELFGVAARGFKATNLALHAASAVLVFLLLRRLTQKDWPSAFAAAVFALHPLNVESVAWIAERKSVLSAFLAIVALHAYVSYARRPTMVRYLFVAACFALGLLAKPMLVTLPMVMLLLDCWPLDRFVANAASIRSRAARLILEKLPLLALSAGCAALTIANQRAIGAMRTVEEVSLAGRWGNAVVAYGWYLLKLVWPRDLAVFYPHRAWPAGLIIIAALALLLVTAGAVWLLLRRRRPALAVGWCWFLGVLVPVIGIVQVGDQSYADRYAYLPMIGLLLALAGAVEFARDGRRARAALAVAVLLALGVATWIQTGYWQSSVALFERALAVTPKNALAHNNLGAALEQEGDAEGAKRHYRAAIEDDGQYALAYVNYGSSLAREGNHVEALAQFEKARAIRRDNPMALNNMGVILMKQDRRAQAVGFFRQAVTLRPDFTAARTNLGLALAGGESPGEAISLLETSLREDPADADAHFALGLALAKTGRGEEAIRHFEKAASLNPRDAQAHIELGIALAAQRQFPRAEAALNRALAIAPGDVGATVNLAKVFFATGRDAEAIGRLEQSIQSRPTAAAHNLMGIAMARSGRIDAAAEHFAKAVELDPSDLDARANLDRARSMQGNP